MNAKLLLIPFTLIFPIYHTKNLTENNSKRIVCYYTFPNSDGALKPEDVEPELCTHILVGFAHLDGNSISLPHDKWNVVRKIVKMKENNPDLKVFLSVGGGGGDFGFQEMVKNESSRTQFIRTSHLLLDDLQLDGLDIDWEFPQSILHNDRDHFTQLLREIRDDINKSVKKYLLSVAVAAPVNLVAASYDVPEMNKLVDFINIMCYDYNFFSIKNADTGMNAPLYSRSSDNSHSATKNINYTCNMWVRQGMSKEKINVGLPVYARTYTLASRNRTYLGAPAIGHGKLGGRGSAKYGQVCDFMKKNNLVPVFDEETKSPYVTDGTEWVSFENDLSMKYKGEYIHNNGYGGLMIFSLNTDDFRGICKNGTTFPNTRILKNTFTR